MAEPMCQSADHCTNDARWRVEGRYVKPHVCCDVCKAAWKRMFAMPGGVKFRRLAKGAVSK
jgi:hypothetical protein